MSSTEEVDTVATASAKESTAETAGTGKEAALGTATTE